VPQGIHLKPRALAGRGFSFLSFGPNLQAPRRGGRSQFARVGDATKHDQAQRLNRIQATSTRGARARIRRAAIASSRATREHSGRPTLSAISRFAQNPSIADDRKLGVDYCAALSGLAKAFQADESQNQVFELNVSCLVEMAGDPHTIENHRVVCRVDSNAHHFSNTFSFLINCILVARHAFNRF